MSGQGRPILNVDAKHDRKRKRERERYARRKHLKKKLAPIDVVRAVKAFEPISEIKDPNAMLEEANRQHEQFQTDIANGRVSSFSFEVILGISHDVRLIHTWNQVKEQVLAKAMQEFCQRPDVSFVRCFQSIVCNQK